MKVPFTSDGSGVPVFLNSEEAAEIRRQSDEWDWRLGQFMDDEAGFLRQRYLELRGIGTTIREPLECGRQGSNDVDGVMYGS